MKLLTLFSLVLFFSFSQAQSIKGKLTNEQGEPLSFATIQLLNADSSLKKVETSNIDGEFQFRQLEPLEYFIAVSYLGYETYSRKVDLSVEDGNLNVVQLKFQSTELAAVEIVDEKPLVEIEPDKTVFNVSKNLATTGDNGVELLRKAPGLQVDNNDNILVEGKSGITIYINGKQSYLQGEDCLPLM